MCETILLYQHKHVSYFYYKFTKMIWNPHSSQSVSHRVVNMRGLIRFQAPGSTFSDQSVNIEGSLVGLVSSTRFNIQWSYSEHWGLLIGLVSSTRFNIQWSFSEHWVLLGWFGFKQAARKKAEKSFTKLEYHIGQAMANPPPAKRTLRTTMPSPLLLMTEDR
jgi:hypothetical protein